MSARIQTGRNCAILLIRVGCSRATPALTHHDAAGGCKVQADDFHDSIRPGLIAMLPRLKRFADLLVGERDEATALLSRALNVMLAEQHRYQRGRALDGFAFGEIYRHWLAEHRSHSDSPGQVRIDDANFAALFGSDGDALTTRFLAELPAQQRLTLLLVYGEKFDYVEAGRVLDVPADTIASRLIRISAALADTLSAKAQGNTHIDARYPESASELS